MTFERIQSTWMYKSAFDAYNVLAFYKALEFIDGHFYLMHAKAPAALCVVGTQGTQESCRELLQVLPNIVSSQ